MNTPMSLAQLVSALRVLPGVGPKSALRMAYHLLQHNRSGAAQLAQALQHALDHLGHCQRCHTFSESPLCDICADTSRDPQRLCIVEMPVDLLRLEESRCFNGFYFVLMGRLSPLDGIGPQELQLDRLQQRALDGVVQEVILATNYTAEGEATAHVISEMLRGHGLTVSRIARGMPVGGELEFTDPGTLAQAFYERRHLASS